MKHIVEPEGQPDRYSHRKCQNRWGGGREGEGTGVGQWGGGRDRGAGKERVGGWGLGEGHGWGVGGGGREEGTERMKIDMDGGRGEEWEEGGMMIMGWRQGELGKRGERM